MNVQVKDGLACTGADIKDRSVSMFDVALARNLRCSEMAAADDLCVGGFGFLQSSKMTLRNDEYMRRRLRIDVFEGKDMLIFINFLGRNLAADDAAEKAIRISHLRHLSQLLAER